MTGSRLRRRLLHVASADWDDRQIRQGLRARARAPGSVRRLEDSASRVLGIQVIAFGSARSALAALLMAAHGGDARVVLPAYTCVAVPNAVRAAGQRAAWVDVDGPNLDPGATLQALQAGDALIAQSTYGVPVATGLIAAARDLGAFVIEDRAHRFDGAAIEGDGAVFSLEHSKVVSGGQGGLAWAADERRMDALRRIRDSSPTIGDREAARVLRTSATQAGLTRLLGVDSLAGGLARRLALRIPVVSVAAQSEGELAGAGFEVTRLHEALAEVGIASVERAAESIHHRQTIAGLYRTLLGDRTPPWLPADVTVVRYPILVDDADAVAARLRGAGWDLGPRWFDAPVHPRGSVSDYTPGSAPNAERLATSVLTLPTHRRMDPATARRLVDVLAAATEAR